MPDRVFDGGKLRDRRVIKRLSQATLAEGLHVKVNAVYRWENGLAAPLRSDCRRSPHSWMPI